MAWYWWSAICLYIGIGGYLGGFWFSEDGENVWNFLFSISAIGLFWPITLMVVLIGNFHEEITDFFSTIFITLKLLKKRVNKENYDNMRLERMGADEEYWKV